MPKKRHPINPKPGFLSNKVPVPGNPSKNTSNFSEGEKYIFSY